MCGCLRIREVGRLNSSCLAYVSVAFKIYVCVPSAPLCLVAGCTRIKYQVISLFVSLSVVVLSLCVQPVSQLGLFVVILLATPA